MLGSPCAKIQDKPAPQDPSNFVNLKLCGDVQAAEKPKGSIERLLLVAAFAVSAFQAVRPMRASLPIMGETVEVGAFPAWVNPHPC